MDRPRIVWFLRVATSVVCLIVCGLLVALWVRSYRWMDQLGGPLSPTRIVFAGSIRGGLLVQTSNNARGYRWNVRSTSLVQPGVSRSAFRFGSEFRLIDRGFGLPHWFLVALTAALAAVPWIRWSKRFSLRTLLIATTVVAVVLGMIVFAFARRSAN